MNIIRIFKRLKYLFKNDETLFMYFLKEHVEDQLEFCKRFKNRNTEELEDTLFHINSYLELESSLLNTKYYALIPLHKKVKRNGIQALFKHKNKEEVDLYIEFIEELEKGKAVEKQGCSYLCL